MNRESLLMSNYCSGNVAAVSVSLTGLLWMLEFMVILKKI